MDRRYHEIVLLDPTDPQQVPREVAAVGLLLRQPRASLSAEQLPDMIERVLEPAERNEILGDGPYLPVDQCCARCGGALGLTTCNGCGRSFRDDKFHSPKGLSLPKVLRQWFIDHGHTFTG